jgi:hypothetical protein
MPEHVLLKDGEYEERLARAKFLKSLRSGFSPEAAVARAKITFKRIKLDIENGDDELKDVFLQYQAGVLALQRVPGEKLKTPTTADIRNLALQTIAPRVLEHLSTRLDQLDPSPMTNPDNWKADQDLLMKCAGMMTQLLPKEVITDNTHRKEETPKSAQERQARIELLEKKRRLLRGEVERAEENNQKLVEYELNPPEEEAS